MGTVFVDISMSLDGFITGPDDEAGRGLGEGGECLHNWIFGGPWTYSDQPDFVASGVDREVLDAAFARTGAVIMGRGVFDAAAAWGGEAPFPAPCFVLTHHDQDVPETTGFTFVTDGIESALDQARAAAADKDISIMGGADVIQQYLRAGHVQEIQIHLAPVLLGSGKRLFDGIGGQLALVRTRLLRSRHTTHLMFDVFPRSDFPAGLPKPARRALSNGGYERLEQLSEVSEGEVAALHGMGPRAIRLLRDSLAAKGLSFGSG